jgi:hypothetical protein
MTSQGSAHGRFTRSIKQRNLFQAEIAAREMRGLSLPDSLDLVILNAAVRTRPARTSSGPLALPARGRSVRSDPR